MSQQITNKRITPRVVSVPYAAIIAINSDNFDVLNIGALAGNLFLENDFGIPTDGQRITVRFQQDSTGGRTITFDSGYAFGTDITTALIPSAANAKWEQVFEYNAADAKWRAVAIVRGF